MKKKWLILIGILLLFSITFANKTDGKGFVDDHRYFSSFISEKSTTPKLS